jgi:hypothetical protein
LILPVNFIVLGQSVVFRTGPGTKLGAAMARTAVSFEADGPAADGSCPRVAIGDVLPCAGHALMPAGSGAGAQPYAVSGQATLCPVTLAAALAVTSDSVLMLDA